MQPTTTTNPNPVALTNPYSTHNTASVLEVQLLLLIAIVSFIVGVLLAEQTILRRILSAANQALTPGQRNIETA